MESAQYGSYTRALTSQDHIDGLANARQRQQIMHTRQFPTLCQKGELFGNLQNSNTQTIIFVQRRII